MAVDVVERATSAAAVMYVTVFIVSFFVFDYKLMKTGPFIMSPPDQMKIYKYSLLLSSTCSSVLLLRL